MEAYQIKHMFKCSSRTIYNFIVKKILYQAR